MLILVVDKAKNMDCRSGGTGHEEYNPHLQAIIKSRRIKQ